MPISPCESLPRSNHIESPSGIPNRNALLLFGTFLRLIVVQEPVLVTGAAGFIGFHVARRLLEDGRAVVGVDNLNPYYDPSLKEARRAVLAKHDGFRIRSKRYF